MTKKRLFSIPRTLDLLKSLVLKKPKIKATQKRRNQLLQQSSLKAKKMNQLKPPNLAMNQMNPVKRLK